MRKNVLNVLLLVLAWMTIPSWGAYRMGESKPVKIDGSPSSHPSKRTPFPSSRISHANPEEMALAELSNEFSIPTERLEYFRRLHHGYEEIVPALVIAREAQVEPGQVLQLRVENQSWKDIAARYHIELKPLNEEVLSIIKPLRKNLPKKIMTERPTTRDSNESLGH